MCKSCTHIHNCLLPRPLPAQFFNVACKKLIKFFWSAQLGVAWGLGYIQNKQHPVLLPTICHYFSPIFGPATRVAHNCAILPLTFIWFTSLQVSVNVNVTHRDSLMDCNKHDYWCFSSTSVILLWQYKCCLYLLVECLSFG